MKLFDNPNKVVLMVIAFLVLAFSYRACSAEDGYLELGPTFTGGFNGGVGLVYTERFDRFDFGVQLIGEQDARGTTVGNNGGVTFSYVMKRPDGLPKILPAEALLGPTVWINTDPKIVTSELGFNLGLRWYIGDRFHWGWRHWSNAGTKGDNNGQDLLVLGVRFQ